jgi:glycine/D-amino acid oxidase-like deaminating enzyme
MTPRINPVLWLEQAMAQEESEPAAPCPPLAGAVRADVCIVGGGFVGLWTALEIADQAPDADVVVIDAEACGFGASGRNGGWMTSWWDELDALVARFGPEQGRWLAAQSSAAIDRIEAVCREEGIEAHVRRAGGLVAATAPAQRRAFEALADEPGMPLRRVDETEMRRRTGSPILLDGVEMTDAAKVHPALLARGLRRLALRRGIRIYEGTAMRELERGPKPAVVTSAGRVDAGAIVITMGAWAAQVRELRRAFLPVASHIVATAPIPDRLDALGWNGGELLGDARMLVHYAQVSPDGRIVFGRGGGVFGTAGRVVGRHFVDPAAVAVVAEDLRRWFPSLADVPITHAWGGPVDHAPGHLPFVGTIGDHETVHYAAGFSGNGVAPSAFVGRILGRRALGVDDEHTRCGLVGGVPGYLPPEPFRTAGGLVVRDAVRRAEATEERGRRPDPVTDRLRRLVWFTMPSALEPRMRAPQARSDDAAGDRL